MFHITKKMKENRMFIKELHESHFIHRNIILGQRNFIFVINNIFNHLKNIIFQIFYAISKEYPMP